MAAGQQGKLLERVHHRRGVAHHGMPGNQAGEADGDGDIEHGADDQRGDDADRQVALRVLAFLGGRRDGVEADVSEEDDGPTGQHARPTVGHKGMPVGRMNEADDGEDEDEDGDEFEAHHHIVGRGRLADAAHQDDGEDHDDEKGGDVEAEVPTGRIERLSSQVLQAVGKISGRDPARRGMEPEPVEQVNYMSSEAYADAHI